MLDIHRPKRWIFAHHIRGNQIRLGIEAPKDVPVFREELAKDETEGLLPGLHRVKPRRTARTLRHHQPPQTR